MSSHLSTLILSAERMRFAEQSAMNAGISGWQMMWAAGNAVAETIIQHYPKQRVLILCGPGNNGGDGYVVARQLIDKGWLVEVVGIAPEKLKGDAAKARQYYAGTILSFDDVQIEPEMLVVDALFGIGLTRLLEGKPASFLAEMNANHCRVVAVDIPSGIDSNTGVVLGIAPYAEITVTFAAKKPGHVLLPGKAYAGKVLVADIGIDHVIKRSIVGADPRLASSIKEETVVAENTPALWLSRFPWPQVEDHKYTRGKVIVAGGGIRTTGAARLAATAALRMGAGLVAVACDTESLPIYASHLTSVMTEVADDVTGFSAVLSDRRIKALLLGPGNGVTQKTKSYVSLALAKNIPVVFDADAVTVFAGEASTLKDMINAPTILTPHEGEFARLFSSSEIDIKTDKMHRAYRAASYLNAVIVLKGADTVIAAPDGRVAINTNAPATLATAGTGDVLAGMITGLVAQGMEVFDAACAGVWLHADAAKNLGCGMIAEDLLTSLVNSLHNLTKIN
ncbi:MAG: NAD(P)H-hydrate dehydratase [Rickettsiales bacterium]